MTEKGKQPASNSSTSNSSVSADDAASPLTMADLLAVLTIITGGDIPSQVIIDRLRGRTGNGATGTYAPDTGTDATDTSTDADCDDFEAVSAGSSDGNDSASVTAVASTLALAPVPITSAAPVTPAPAPIAGPSSFMDPSTRFYVVFVGRRVGVYTAWATVLPLVVGVPGACYCKFNSRALAEAAFEDAQVTGGVRIV